VHPAPGGNQVGIGSNQLYREWRFRLGIGTSINPGGRGKDFKGPGKIKDLNIIEEVNSYGSGHRSLDLS
jgi:hypothetical protein